MNLRFHIQRDDKASPYANREDFGRVFSEGLSSLYQLSLLLTGDHHRAEKCFVSGIEDCVNENHVFKEWARSWAKRAIIQNAIRELKPRSDHSASFSSRRLSSRTHRSNGAEARFTIETLLGLPDFERFVFVMSVLENYSQHECALLLGCSISEVREARNRALMNLAVARPMGDLTAELLRS